MKQENIIELKNITKQYEDNIVYVKFHGACASCGSIDYTINDVLLNAILDEVAEVKDVINVTL